MTRQGRWTRRALLQLVGTTLATASAGRILPRTAHAGSQPGRGAWAALEQKLQGRLLTPQLPWRNATGGAAIHRLAGGLDGRGQHPGDRGGIGC